MPSQCPTRRRPLVKWPSGHTLQAPFTCKQGALDASMEGTHQRSTQTVPVIDSHTHTQGQRDILAWERLGHMHSSLRLWFRQQQQLSCSIGRGSLQPANGPKRYLVTDCKLAKKETQPKRRERERGDRQTEIKQSQLNRQRQRGIVIEIRCTLSSWVQDF